MKARSNRSGWLPVTILLLLAATPAWGVGPEEEKPYVNPRLLIQPGELAQVLDSPTIRVIDLRPLEAYTQGHIRNAVHLDVAALDDPHANLHNMPIHMDDAKNLFSALGIGGSTTVVGYDAEGGLRSARLLYVLEYFGHRHVRVLNGGMDAWKQEGRPLTQDPPQIFPWVFTPRPNPSLSANLDWIGRHLKDSEVVILDARSAAEFRGDDVRAERGGHIPGAVNIEWSQALNPDKTFKRAYDLRRLFEAAGVTSDRTIVIYCHTGTRAAHTYLALRLLGYPHLRVYDGSWEEWGNNPMYPLEK